ncbi:hypothetical protein [Streptomyces sp. NPDC004376]
MREQLRQVRPPGENDSATGGVILPDNTSELMGLPAAGSREILIAVP